MTSSVLICTFLTMKNLGVCYHAACRASSNNLKLTNYLQPDLTAGQASPNQPPPCRGSWWMAEGDAGGAPEQGVGRQGGTLGAGARLPPPKPGRCRQDGPGGCSRASPGGRDG